MIYPEVFPDERKNEIAEGKVFDKLSDISSDYDIFYARSFVKLSDGERQEYEIDFIIAKPCEYIICLEAHRPDYQYADNAY